MQKFSFQSLMIPFAVLLGTFPLAVKADESSNWKAGIAKVAITPSESMWMAGGRRSDEVLDATRSVRRFDRGANRGRRSSRRGKSDSNSRLQSGRVTIGAIQEDFSARCETNTPDLPELTIVPMRTVIRDSVAPF